MNRRNIVWVTIDCGRQDLIYGPQVATPHLDALAREGIRFEQAFSQTNVTLPSHYSMFTGQYLARHGLYSNHSSYKRLSGDSPVKVLQAQGWRTAAFCSVGFLAATLGQEFEFHDSLPFNFTSRWARLLSEAPQPGVRRGPDTMKRALDWLQGHGDDPFFLWIHLFDTHMVYWAPEPFRRQYLPRDLIQGGRESVLQQLKRSDMHFSAVQGVLFESVWDLRYYPALHRAATACADAEIGRLIPALQELGIYDDTLIIVTADHGENLGEHDVYCQHTFLYDETTKVPLILKYFDGRYANRRIESLVQHIDLMPTIGEELGLEFKICQGKSLKPLLEGTQVEVNPVVVSESSNHHQRSMRTQEWQLIRTAEWADQPLFRKKGQLELLRRPTGDGKPEVCNPIEYPQIVQRLEALLDQMAPSLREVCVSEWASIPIAHYYNPGNRDHLYTSHPQQEDLDGLIFRGCPFRIFPTEGPLKVTTARLTRYCHVKTGRHRYLARKDAPLDAQEWRLEGSLGGSIALEALPDTAPLHRYHNPKTGAYLYTLGIDREELLDEERGAWVHQGIIGYVVPNEEAGSPEEQQKAEEQQAMLQHLRDLGYAD
jgi:arylsulfatase A-like enzyme